MARYYPSGGEPGAPFRSRSCMAGTHVECGHVGSIGYGFCNGGSPMLLLRRCSCHPSCALAGRLPLVSRAIWVGLCTCPGTDLAEDRLDQAERVAPDFSEVERRIRERWEKRK
jgi:hypothetical protein